VKNAGLLTKLVTIIFLCVCFAIALCLRIWPPYDRVFSGDWIKFTSNDAYYFLRMVDNFAHNFPRHTEIEPYLLYPYAMLVPTIRLFAWFLSLLIWAVGLGAPTEHTVDIVAVYFPAVLGALMVIPVYFIGRELAGRWCGLLSAALITIMPGEFLGRSILGFTDHHVAETLLATVTTLFLLLAVRTAVARGLSFSHLRQPHRQAIIWPLAYSLLAGVFLGAYILTWMGALLFVFLVSLYFVIQSIIDHLRGRGTEYLCLVGSPLFLVALIISWPVRSEPLNLPSLAIATLLPAVLSAVSWLLTRQKIGRAYYPVTLLGLGVAGLGVLYLISPSLVSSMLAAFSVFFPTGTALTTIEIQPILFPGGVFSMAVVWGNFTTGWFLSLIGLGILIYLIARHGDAVKNLIVVWSLVMLAATLGQRRFAYYFAVNVALLTGYLSWLALRLAGLSETVAKTPKTERAPRHRKGRPKGRSLHVTISHVNVALAVIIVFFVVFSPNIMPAVSTASRARYAPSDAWLQSLDWLRQNTPEPFGNPDAYYQLYLTPPAGESFKYPESAYGVMAWWDYGYWITRVAHRIPNANPSQGAWAVKPVASFFTAQDEKTGNEIANQLGTSYIIVDYEIAYVDPQTGGGKFWAMALWAGKQPVDFFDIYLVPQENQLVPRLLFYPEYYRSLAVRLYNFGGKAVTPEGTPVITYEHRTDRKGRLYKVVTKAQTFKSYEEAQAYISSQPSNTKHRIIGTSPSSSPVPLTALERYQLIYNSEGTVKLSGAGAVPEIKVFSYKH